VAGGYPAPTVLRLATDDDWRALRQRYRNNVPQPWWSCLRVVRGNGARCAVVEPGFRDRDYASEHAAFLADSFDPPPLETDRIHFFSTELPEDRLWDLPDEPGYLGCIVVRHSPLGRVGRTLLVPPAELDGYALCTVGMGVSFFGQRLQVRCVPFAQQDARLGRCSHVAAWICHATAAARGIVPRRRLGEFAVDVRHDLEPGRAFPSTGLSVRQLSALFHDFGLPAVLHTMGSMPATGREAPVPAHPARAHPGTWDTRVIPVACRLLNSGFPLIATTATHAFALVGYGRTPPGSDRVTFVRHDDQLGPYRRVPEPLADVDPDTGVPYGPWVGLLCPTAADLWMVPEAAEQYGARLLLGRGTHPMMLELEAAGQLVFITHGVRSIDFLAGLVDRGYSPEATGAYRMTRLPGWVWVVEAVDRGRRAEGEPDVVAEVVFDPTTPDEDPGPLLVRVPSLALRVGRGRGDDIVPLPDLCVRSLSRTALPH
jgi:hypothetical protein